MACGLPTLAAAASGSLTLVTEGATGRLTDPQKGAKGFAEGLLGLAGDPEGRTRMGAAARERALGYSWPAVLDELIANYRDAIKSSKR